MHEERQRTEISVYDHPAERAYLLPTPRARKIVSAAIVFLLRKGICVVAYIYQRFKLCRNRAIFLLNMSKVHTGFKPVSWKNERQPLPHSCRFSIQHIQLR